ncbi:MAG: BON domain-containing protein [Terriglobales bacterium]
MKKHYLYTSLLALLLAAAFAGAQMRPRGMPGMGQQYPGYPGHYPGQQGPLGTDERTTSDEMRKQVKVDDQTLERQIQEQLATRPEMTRVKVHVKDGVAQLTGVVARKEDRKEARRLAESVPGVRDVKTKLSVNATAANMGSTLPPGASSNTSPSGANTSLGSAPATTASSGTGAGQPTNAGALGQTQSTPGATAPSVANDSIGSPSDLKVQNRIQNDLRASNPAAAGDVAVDVTDSYVILNGSVPDETAMKQVVAVAQSGASGRTVVNKMTVAPAASMGANAGASTGGASGAAATGPSTGTAPARQAGGPVSSGAEQSAPGVSANAAETSSLQTQINNALQKEPTLANDNVSANVSDSEIELSGTVATGKEKQTARRIAQSYAGNRRVVDRITVMGRGQSKSMPGMKPSETPGMDAGTMGTEKPSQTERPSSDR